MFSTNRTDWSLLAKELAGETNEQEKQAVAEWLDKSSANRELYQKIKSDWKIMDTMHVQFNVDKAWNKLHDRILAGEPKPSAEEPMPRLRSWKFALTPLRIAAALLLLALLGAAAGFLVTRSQQVNVTAAVDERGKKIVLPDGSSVYLNGNSSIRYTKSFNKRTRDIRLTGEAFFEVAPDKTKPFRILANNACIKVLGTSFNVNASGNHGNLVEVYVSTGLVELSEAGDDAHSILLRPGNIGRLEANKITAHKTVNENCIAWKTGIMTFNETRLSEVTPVLNKVYNVQIIIREPGVDTTRITGSYSDDTLDRVLEVICKQNHLTVEKSDNMIYLSRQ
jgi:ferric-dicitrate binding protein FerR (iron transport regulator)